MALAKPKITGMKKIVQDILAYNNKTLNDLKESGYMKVKSGGFMDLNVDYLGNECKMDKFSVAHNYIQSGDLMKDPDMMFYDDGTKWWAASFEQDGFPKISQISMYCENEKLMKNIKMQQQHQTFSNQWARNLNQQGFTKSKKIEFS